jgi:ubiquinol-cytochrome c reductase cytochrome b subunit
VLTRRMVLWLDDRLALASLAKRNLRKAFPDHWSFLLGELALYCFVILVLTGVFLTFFFEASSREVVYQGPYEPLQGREISAAYDSVLRMSLEIRAGLVMRQIHHWTALVFVGAIVVHAMRVFFTGAFRRPRELNWLIGVTLLALAITNGFLGYSLPDDLIAGGGLRIAQSAVLSIPLVGDDLFFLLAGGEFERQRMISRMFVGHVLLVPALIIGLVTLHMALLLRQRHTQFPGGGSSERALVGFRLWPTYAAKSIGLALLVAAVLVALGGLVEIAPVWLRGGQERLWRLDEGYAEQASKTSQT